MTTPYSETARQRLPIRTKLFFGVGQGVEASATFVASTFLLFYLTGIAGISPAVAGTIIFLSLVIDAVADPLIGSWSDRSKTRWGRRLPFMVAGLPIVCLSSFALFAMPTGGGTTVAILAALLLNISLRVGTSLFALPYSALTAELTTDYDERSSVTMYRMIFGFVGTVLTIAPAFRIIFRETADYTSPSSYVNLGFLVSTVVLAMGLICIGGVRRAVMASPVEHLPDTATSNSLYSDIRDLFRNGSFVLLFFTCLSLLTISGSMNALNLYAFTYYWKLPTALNQAPILGFQLGLLLGIPITAFLLQRLEKRDVLFGGVIALVIAQALPVLIASNLTGPLPNLPATTFLVIGSGVFGACNSLFFIAIQSMVADAVDEHESKFGQRCEGLYYSSLVFSTKAATGIGSLVAGFILSWIGLKASTGVPTRISPSSTTSLGYIWGVGHAAAFLIVAPLILRYRLNRKRHQEMIEELAVHRRAAQA